MVLSQIALGLMLLDAYSRGTASNCFDCLGVGASDNLRTCTARGDYLYVHSTEELVHCSAIQLKSIIQPSAMIDIAPQMSIIVPHPPAQDSLSMQADAVSGTDTFSLLSETPLAALTMSIDAY